MNSKEQERLEWIEKEQRLKSAIIQSTDLACHHEHLNKTRLLVKKLQDHYKSRIEESKSER